jgi:ribosomal protein S18 acetylase RimI-like enzyme
MNVRDWRDADRDLLQPLYARGQRGWLDALGWDTSRSLREVEQARTTWGLPGLLAADPAGDIRGWTFFLPENNVLHVGGLSADTPKATSALVDALVQVSESHGAETLSCFMFDEAPGLSPELSRHGFDVEPFLYLARPWPAGLERPPRSGSDPVPTGVRPGSDQGQTRFRSGSGPDADSWQPRDVAAAAALLREAYGPETGRHFAPSHTPAEWERYVRNLVEQTACGHLNVEATRLVRAGDRIDAMVLVTALSSETAHLAQVAVHPSRRGEGLAAVLIEQATAIAATQGYAQTTLLVGASNAPARRLYETLGFSERARFVSARRRTRRVS